MIIGDWYVDEFGVRTRDVLRQKDRGLTGRIPGAYQHDFANNARLGARRDFPRLKGTS